MSSFWSGWVLVLTLACLGLLVFVLCSTWKVQRKDTTEETVGHNFDGIEEYDNPMPMWWIGLFVGSFVFTAGYLCLYPGIWPERFDGLLNWSSVGELQRDQIKHSRRYQPLFAAYAATSIDELQGDRKALSMGKRIFLNNCAVCHASDAGGNYGFPRLTDHNWIWGGSPETIKTTILYGRNGQMPAWGPLLGEQKVRAVASYVRSLSNLKVTASPSVLEEGREVFASTCAVCHGPDGKGNQTVGAPDLTDDSWLYGSSQARVEYTIRKGRNGVMPAWKDILGEEKVHLVAAYVYSLSHKKEKRQNTAPPRS